MSDHHGGPSKGKGGRGVGSLGGGVACSLVPNEISPVFSCSLKVFFFFDFGVSCLLKYQKHNFFVPVFPALFSFVPLFQ